MATFKISFILYFLMMIQMNQVYSQNPESVVQHNLDAYNARNIQVFMTDFSDDVKLINFSDQKVMAEGKEAIEKLYSDLFAQSPNLHSTILKRMVMGNKVIDHESIVGRKGSKEAIELIMVYEVKDSKIFKMSVIRPNE